MSLLTSVEKLNFSNFVEWRFVIEALIMGEGGKLDDLNNCSKALQILRASVGKETIPFIQNVNTAQETMTILCDKFGKPNEDLIFEKMLSLFSVKKKEEETNNQFISRCRQLYNDINSAKTKFGDNKEITISESLLLVIITNGLSNDNQDMIRKWKKSDLNLEFLETKLSLQGPARIQSKSMFLDQNARFATNLVT